MNRHFARLSLLSAFCLTGLVTCNPLITSKKAQSADSAQYEKVMVLGSTIPQLVKKGEQADPTSTVKIIGGDDATRRLEGSHGTVDAGAAVNIRK